MTTDPGGGTTSLRVAVLASGWAGFNDAAFGVLAERGVELLVIYEDAVPDTDYRAHSVQDYAAVMAWRSPPAAERVTAALRDFAPDVVLMQSWHHPFYRCAIETMPATTLRVLWMDNVWRGTPRQWLGRAVAPWWVRRLFHVVMVPSDRSEFFARRLGFAEADVIRGSLSADTTTFGSEPHDGAELAARRRFIAGLRLVHHKGADVLAEAYAGYRDLVDDPWDLAVAGIGPMEEELRRAPGVDLLGFCQPHELAAQLRASSCLVVPSREEPYGVIVHEGAASALPIVTTYFVGAVPLFVQDGQNGWVVPRADPEALARAMVQVSSAPSDRLGSMSNISWSLASRLSTDGLARHLHEELDRRVSDLRNRRPRDDR